MCLECCQGCLQQVVFLIYRIHKKKLYFLILSFLSPSGQFGLMSDDMPKVVNSNFLRHLHHFCILDNQGFSFLLLKILHILYTRGGSRHFHKKKGGWGVLENKSDFKTICFKKKQKILHPFKHDVDIFI
jgi:hypothetical protein